ncbi:hypothetical protein BH23ACT9_BH23ACT9_27880 [soil metagenome]
MSRRPARFVLGAVLLGVLAVVAAAGPAQGGTTASEDPVDDQVEGSEPPASIGPPLDLRATPDPVPDADPEAAADAGAAVPGDAAAVGQVLADIATDQADDPPADVLAGLLGDGQSVAWSHHDLTAAPRAFDHLFAHQARLVFTVGMWAVAAAVWLLGVVMRFDLGHLLVGDLGGVAGGYASLVQTGGGLPLVQFMLLLAVAHAGWQVFRHRGQAALAEVLVALVITAVGAYVMADAPRAACTAVGAMGDLTRGTIALTTSAPDPPSRDRCAPAGVPLAGSEGTGLAVQPAVLQTFVTEPFLMLQWGRVPAVGTPCRQVADALLADRAWGDDETPRAHMQTAGCADMAAFNAEMSVQRVAGAVAYAVGASAFALAVVLIVGTVLVAQVAGVLLMAAMPIALVLGIAPGPGRLLLRRWLLALLRVAVLFVGSGFFLAILLAGVGAVLAGVAAEALLVRVVAATTVAWSLVLLRIGWSRGSRFEGIGRLAMGGRRAGGGGVPAPGDARPSGRVDGQSGEDGPSLSIGIATPHAVGAQVSGRQVRLGHVAQASLGHHLPAVVSPGAHARTYLAGTDDGPHAAGPGAAGRRHPHAGAAGVASLSGAGVASLSAAGSPGGASETRETATDLARADAAITPPTGRVVDAGRRLNRPTLTVPDGWPKGDGAGGEARPAAAVDTSAPRSIAPLNADVSADPVTGAPGTGPGPVSVTGQPVGASGPRSLVDAGPRPPADAGLRSPADAGLRPPIDPGLRPPLASGLRPPIASGPRSLRPTRPRPSVEHRQVSGDAAPARPSDEEFGVPLLPVRPEPEGAPTAGHGGAAPRTPAATSPVTSTAQPVGEVARSGPPAARSSDVPRRRRRVPDPRPVDGATTAAPPPPAGPDGR